MLRSKHAVKRQRPTWWTQEGVLAKLQSGQFVLDVCKEAAGEMAATGTQISVSRLRAEISTWTESASWGEQFRAALGLWKRSGPGAMVLSKDWHDDFLTAMQRSGGNAESAAETVGIGYGIVLAVLDRRNNCYDAKFAERFRIAELERVGRVRERYMDLAENGEGKNAVRAQERIIEISLPALHGQAHKVEVSGKVQHDHDHQHLHLHQLSQDQMREVVVASQNRVRRINTGRQGLLPADTRDPEQAIELQPQVDRVELRERGAIHEAVDRAIPIIRESMDSIGPKPS